MNQWRVVARFFIVSSVIYSLAAFAHASDQIWTDGNGDGLPDPPVLSGPPVGSTVTVDLWFDSGSFQFTNYIVFAQRDPCLSFISADYVITGGTNFPVDTFSNPSAVGLGGFGFPPTAGTTRVGVITLRKDVSGQCCVSPIVDPQNTFETFSVLGAPEGAYHLFGVSFGTCWGQQFGGEESSWGAVQGTFGE
jgi:hypothetical protein